MPAQAKKRRARIQGCAQVLEFVRRGEAASLISEWRKQRDAGVSTTLCPK
jgi:hypothetical protein